MENTEDSRQKTEFKKLYPRFRENGTNPIEGFVEEPPGATLSFAVISRQTKERLLCALSVSAVRILHRSRTIAVSSHSGNFEHFKQSDHTL